jgi:uncharacterized protein (TIGR03435 family)
MDIQGFDIVAKVPVGAAKEQFALMLQDLLVRRFKLAFHIDQKEMPIYEMTIAKNGPKLKESVTRVDAIAAVQPAAPRPAEPRKESVDKNGFPIPSPGQGIRSSGRNGLTRMDVTGSSMEEFVKVLTRHADRPVVDATGLKGKYDFTLYWVREEPVKAFVPGSDAAPAPSDAASGPTLFHAMQDQLGLKLEAKKGDVEIVVIDRIEKTPTEN